MRLPLGFLCLCLGLGVHAQELRFSGQAYDLESGELLYSEHHRVQLTQEGRYSSSTASYRYPDGREIAKKELDYSSNPLSPVLQFDDFRAQTSLSVRPESNQLLLDEVQGDDSRLEVVELPEDGPLVVDAGFDQLVMSNWSKLVSGQVLEFDFLALSRASLVPFKVEMIAGDEDTVTLAIAPQNWLIGLLMDPIRLVYERDTARLLRYYGVTNIPVSEDGEVREDNYHAEIRYSYESDPRFDSNALAVLGFSASEQP